MKRKTAREILAESFRELAEIKPVDKITVPNIIENCGYKAFAEMKKEGSIVSPVRCKWEPAE